VTLEKRVIPPGEGQEHRWTSTGGAIQYTSIHSAVGRVEIIRKIPDHGTALLRKGIPMTAGPGESPADQELALLHLCRLHSDIGQARAAGNRWMVPLLWGGLCGIGACIIVGIGSAVVINLVLGLAPSPVPGLLGILAMCLVWVVATWFLRLRAQKAAASRIVAAQAALDAATGEVERRLPELVRQVGGAAMLREARGVADALAVVRRTFAPAPVAAAPLPFAAPGIAQPGTPYLAPGVAQTAEFKRRAPAAIYPLACITLGVYFFVWIYKIHKELYCRLGPARATSPGLALGLLFIPLFNFVWMIILLHKVARLSNQMLDEAGRPYEKTSTGGIMAMLIIGQVFNVISLGLASACLVAIPLLWVSTAKVQSVLNRAWAAQGLIRI
jgi:hypothetical protein